MMKAIVMLQRTGGNQDVFQSRYSIEKELGKKIADSLRSMIRTEWKMKLGDTITIKEET